MASEVAVRGGPNWAVRSRASWEDLAGEDAVRGGAEKWIWARRGERGGGD